MFNQMKTSLLDWMAKGNFQLIRNSVVSWFERKLTKLSNGASKIQRNSSKNRKMSLYISME